MKNSPDLIVVRVKWIVGGGYRCATEGVGWGGDGAKTTMDRVVGNAVKDVLWAMQWAAPWGSVEKVNSKENKVARRNGGGNVDFEETMER